MVMKYQICKSSQIFNTIPFNGSTIQFANPEQTTSTSNHF